MADGAGPGPGPGPGGGAALRSEAALFELLDALHGPAAAIRADAKEAKAGRKQALETFLRQCEEVWARLLHYRNAGLELARLFHHRMLDTNNERLAAYALVVETYRAQAARAKRPAELVAMAAALGGYCATHRQDPDNSLLGLAPSARALQACHDEERDAARTPPPPGAAPAGGGAPAAPERTPASPMAGRAPAPAAGGGRRATTGYAEGELVLVDRAAAVEEPQWRYARVARAADGEDATVSVFLAPDERTREELRARVVRPLCQGIARALGQAKSLQRMVADPFEGFLAAVQEEVRAATRQFLGAQGLDAALLDELLANASATAAPPLRALPRVRRLLGDLEAMQSRPALAAFYAEVNATAGRRLAAFLEEVDGQPVFAPTKAANLQQLAGFNFSSFAANRIRTAYGRCDACMDTLRIRVKEMTNGEAKARLTHWWLEKIEADTHAFLRAKKYAFDAYPAEYLQAPPESMGPVKFNLQLVREILNPLDDKHGTRELVARLKAEIDPRIDEFVADALFVLGNVLPGLPAPPPDAAPAPAPDVAELERLVAAARAGGELDAEQARWVPDLVKDLRYLQRMRQLETSGERVLDVVPVSGLVLSQFYRLENELKTVVELWDAYVQEQAQLRGERTYQRLKTKVYVWRLQDARRLDVMKEFGGTSCLMQLDTGGFFSAALTEHGEVYAWGKGLSGELGVGEKKQVDEPVLVEALQHKKVVQLSCGGAMCAAVTADGELYVWGYFEMYKHPLLLPTLVAAELFQHHRIREVSVGPQHLLVLLESGELYAWGKNNKGQLGQGNTRERERPCLVEDLRSKRIKRVRAGEDVSAALSEAGELYVWGKNEDGMLGTASAAEVVDRPARVVGLAAAGRVADVALGSRHAVALTEQGEVFAWGARAEPAPVDELPGRAVRIACGQLHVVAATETDVYTWRAQRGTGSERSSDGHGHDGAGRRHGGAQGRKPAARREVEVELVEGLHGKHVLQIACGSGHTAALVEDPAFFGVALVDVMAREKGRRVPSAVQRMGAYLLSKADTEGLFRTSGRAPLVAELRKAFDRDDEVALHRARDPHTVAALLKDYLRALPEPLVPYDQADALLAVDAAPIADAAKYALLHALLLALPPHHQDLLRYLLGLWHAVAARADQNRMTTQALAIALAPCVFRRRDPPPPGVSAAASGSGRGGREDFILGSNGALRLLIAWAPGFTDEPAEALAAQAAALGAAGRAERWQLWAWRLEADLAAPDLPASRGLSGPLLASGALQQALTSAAQQGLDSAAAHALNALFLALLRVPGPPPGLGAAEARVREAAARVAAVRSLGEERLEEFVAEEQARLRALAALLDAQRQLHALARRAAGHLRALASFLQAAAPAVAEFRATAWPLEGGWRVLEAAGTVAPLLRRGFAPADLGPLCAAADARDAEEASALVAAGERYVEVRTTQLTQLSFLRKKLQSALQQQASGAGGPGAALQDKFQRLREGLLVPPELAPAAARPLLDAACAAAGHADAAMEGRRAGLQAAVAKLEAIFADLIRPPTPSPSPSPSSPSPSGLPARP